MEPQEDQDTTADPALLEADDDASGPVPASRGAHSSNVPRSEDAREARLAQVVDDLGGRFNRAAGTVLIREWADAELAPLRARVAELEAEVRAGESALSMLDGRLGDVRDEYRKAAESWDRQRNRLNEEVERLRGWIDRAERAEAALAKGREDADEYDAILTRQGELLTRTANALRGDPPPLTSWSHHDVPERAQEAAALLTKVRALAAEHDHCSGCPTPWWLRAALAAAGPAVADGEGATSEADAWDEGYTFGRLMQFDADWADRNPSQIHNNRASLVRNLEYAKGRNHDNPHRPASPVVAPSATDEGGLAAELRKAHAQNTERPDETKRRMPTLRPAEGGATE